MLKDEPEDLTHLAPTAGDVCVPLEDPPFLSDMLDEFILENESYCPLLSSELQTELPVSDLTDSALRNQEHLILGDSLKSKDLDINIPDRDPFIYRDSPSRGSCSTELHSPTLSRVIFLFYLLTLLTYFYVDRFFVIFNVFVILNF